MTKLAAKVQTRINTVKDAQSEKGATAVEYGLMVALIAVAIIVAVSALGGKISNLFTGVSNKINNVP